MFLAECLDVNAQGNLTIGRVDTVSLTERYGTPLYAMDEDMIRQNCRSYLENIKKYFENGGTAAYASKAFCCRAICSIVKEEGMSLDCVSIGELYTAQSVDFPAERIYYHGNNKTADELMAAISYGVGRIVVDNLDELRFIEQIALSQNKVVDVLIRIKPGIDPHTHSFIRTGQIDSKFGMGLETGEAMEAAKFAANCPSIGLKGIHCHIGSQILEYEPFERSAEVMLGFMTDVIKETGVAIRELNLGGGYGVQYTASDLKITFGEYIEKVSAAVKATCAKLDIPVPYVILEPGRSIVANTCVTLYKVGGIKNIPGIRTYVSIDGGMTDNIRYALYKSEYQMVVANRARAPVTQKVTVAGKLCETGDLIGEDVPLGDVKVGDTLAVLGTGAYNYSMASNYNRIPRPAVVMVKDGESRVVVKRESLENIVQNDLL